MPLPAKPFSEACEQNKDPILEVLRAVLVGSGSVLEIGSGTGQHAVYFARHLPERIWQPSDIAAHLPGISAWIDEAGIENLRPPLALDVTDPHWPVDSVDAVFSANTSHIMSWPQVEAMFRGVGRVLAAGGVFCLYGPFNYGGRHTSPSNARFDAWLRARDPASGLRDVDALERLAEAAGLTLERDYPMPVNNRTLIWRKDPAAA